MLLLPPSQPLSFSMNSACCGEKPVFISVYIVRPREREDLLSGDCYHRLLHRHHGFHHAGSGYDRKAELLLYCRRLRDLACGEHLPTMVTSISKMPNHNAIKIGPMHRNPSHRLTPPACLGDWKKLLLPGFLLRSLTNFDEKKKKKNSKESNSVGKKMAAVMKSLRVDKKPELVEKLLSMFGNHR